MDASHKTQSQLIHLDKQREELKIKRYKWMPAHIIGPALVAVVTLSTMLIPLIIMSTFIAITISSVIYHNNFVAPFQELSNKVKKALLTEFMRIYHPDVDYQYSANRRNAAQIIRHSGLFTADLYEEEDVINGSKGDIDFYLSEVDLKKKRTSKGKTTYHTLLKGLLFKIKIPGRSFPKSRLFSNPSLIKKWFGNGRKNDAYGFWYQTQNEATFNSEMQTLFPFIQHLSRQGELRIHIDGDEITILMESDMKFLDDPTPSLNRSFQDEHYYAKISKQVNSLLYIIDTFIDDLTPMEIEQNLKLRVMEYAETKLKS